jgi:hypothetical protein
LLRWHRELIARRWTYPRVGREQRGLDEAVVVLVVRLARENPRWGYVRIVGECRNLGVRVSATSVRRIHDGPVTRNEDVQSDVAGTNFTEPQSTRVHSHSR